MATCPEIHLHWCRRVTCNSLGCVDSRTYLPCVTGIFAGSEGAAFGTWFLHNALPFASSVFLSPCFVLAAVLLVTHTWMAISSMTSYECALGPEPISYLKVRKLGNIRHESSYKAFFSSESVVVLSSELLEGEETRQHQARVDL